MTKAKKRATDMLAYAPTLLLCIIVWCEKFSTYSKWLCVICRFFGNVLCVSFPLENVEGMCVACVCVCGCVVARNVYISFVVAHHPMFEICTFDANLFLSGFSFFRMHILLLLLQPQNHMAPALPATMNFGKFANAYSCAKLSTL